MRLVWRSGWRGGRQRTCMDGCGRCGGRWELRHQRWQRGLGWTRKRCTGWSARKGGAGSCYGRCNALPRRWGANWCTAWLRRKGRWRPWQRGLRRGGRSDRQRRGHGGSRRPGSRGWRRRERDGMRRSRTVWRCNGRSTGNCWERRCRTPR